MIDIPELYNGYGTKVPIDFLYTTSHRLSIVIFDLGRTVLPRYITLQTDDDDGRNSVLIARLLVAYGRLKTGRIAVVDASRYGCFGCVQYCQSRCQLCWSRSPTVFQSWNRRRVH